MERGNHPCSPQDTVTTISLFCTCVPNKVVAYIFLEGNVIDRRETEPATESGLRGRSREVINDPSSPQSSHHFSISFLHFFSEEGVAYFPSSNNNVIL
jgi:hypothetical protein